jgi:hypothetical protein
VRLDALLVSINDRLGALAARVGLEAGADIEPLTDGWERDLWTLAHLDHPPDEFDRLAKLEGLE